jgi:hypothetical protein
MEETMREMNSKALQKYVDNGHVIPRIKNRNNRLNHEKNIDR